MAASPEVAEIIGGAPVAPTQKALPASQEVIEQPPAEDDTKKAPPKKAPPKKKEAPAAQVAPPADDLDLGLGGGGDEMPPVDAVGASDDDLAAALGL